MCACYIFLKSGHFIIAYVHFLHFRLKDSDLNISVERASELAKKIERELFHLYKDTDNKYKNKYRSLMFNLKDTKNNVSIILCQAWSKCNVSTFTISIVSFALSLLIFLDPL